MIKNLMKFIMRTLTIVYLSVYMNALLFALKTPPQSLVILFIIGSAATVTYLLAIIDKDFELW